MSAPPFDFHRGALYWAAHRLWFDAHRRTGPDGIAVVSHAHSDHVAPHAKAAATAATLDLMAARGVRPRQVFRLKYFHRTPLWKIRDENPIDETYLTMLPAGHVLGSAMVRLESETGSLLYTGDFKLRPSLTAEPCSPAPADILVMETTFGLPKYVFPPSAEVVAQILTFCRETLARNETPVLLAYSLGKAQEVLASLAGTGLPISVAPSVSRISKVYQTWNHRFPPFETWDNGPAPARVLIAPPQSALTLRNRLGRCRMAVLTGWAMDSGTRFRSRADAAFPLSDHADFTELLDMVRRVQPRRVFTLHGFAEEFSAHLRKAGVESWPLGINTQLELPFSI